MSAIGDGDRGGAGHPRGQGAKAASLPLPITLPSRDLFHVSAALVLGVAAWKGVATGQHLAFCLLLPALLRFVPEFWPGNPVVLFGLS
jgi:hypothetical protein